MVKPVGVTNHCVVRFLERVLGFDFTDLKLQYMLEKSIPSLRYIEDKDFIKWIDLHIDVQEFREQVLSFINPHIDDKLKNEITHNPRKDIYINADGYHFVIRGRSLITVY